MPSNPSPDPTTAMVREIIALDPVTALKFDLMIAIYGDVGVEYVDHEDPNLCGWRIQRPDGVVVAAAPYIEDAIDSAIVLRPDGIAKAAAVADLAAQLPPGQRAFFFEPRRPPALTWGW